ncbi:MAG: Fructose/tagatose bisphosphate aldolase [Caldanaerobacter subterraneus]|jgi:fructose-bisphosphate aldolase class II|uniref:Fructose/tagatose bisphosphate aldolase n=3 Tax=Caldanaerobacter subterraneus TaxID=911092 RepID=Q8RDA4_CALS4|nr:MULTISPECIES: class II fructose-1,6-bisphosphate aldolase [Caldanaerobacter]AAM23441.1 Fructose/tagatose bisphosphate aldolase [Caldanaerobacter subterraneus subsp. tengcongensis MB4]ERM91345.1 fructose-bisphosphate aldolase [Caldanaerobacter subterraneus subsp. yonseiensis KB-1]KUK09037.1 MAG: Fructose/tagatose bisphosphate aldolase [Caldanaerobacter subterraneus]MBE3578355.1 class II fructose-1,6-bisphosphate aldolase [Caldanaerobacter subterraneus]MCS3917081.1 fructose-bisphosphate aldol
MLVTGIEILEKAHKEGYAVGAFNTSNLEITQAIVEAAEETRSPVIIQVSEGGLKYAGIEAISAIVRTLAEKATVPIALHLDHGTDFNTIMKCLRNGWTSVMIDASKFPLEENIQRTRKIVEIAHSMGVSVEAEIGKIGGTEDHITVDEREASMTDPEEALRFAKETGVDYLAIAIGTAHGPYKGEPKLDFERLKRIKELLNMPLVLHGASGVPEEAIKKAVSLGINKINIDTDVRQAFTARLRRLLEEDKEVYDPRKILGPCKEAMKEVIKQKMILFGSSLKA